MRKQRSDGVATRAAILEAAADEFAEKGFELGSARAICERAGVNVALVNRYFGSKDELYRETAKMLFGELGAPLSKLADEVTDETSWQGGVRSWIAMFLTMTLPTQKAQKRCAALFRHEVTHPTRFHEEFQTRFGQPVYGGLRRLLAMAIDDEAELDLWTSSIWAQVSVYALSDVSWHRAFRPKGVRATEWADKVCDFICQGVYSRIRPENFDPHLSTEQRL